MNTSIVSVDRVSHRYFTQWAVKDISFELTKNGVFGLLGANGAGKSTVMNIMCGVLRQTDGQVLIKGIDLRKNPIAAKKHIGFLPQKPPLQPELTVEEYLTFCAKLRHIPSQTIKKAVDEAMGKVQINHFKRRVLNNLSGGYQQRVGIAQAIIHKPDFVVLDEPTNGLDPNQILEVRKLIKEIAEERTVVLSTHNLQEVQALCNHVWMINQGSIVFDGNIKDFNNYIVPDTILVTLLASPDLELLKNLPGVSMAEAITSTQYRIYYNDSVEATDQIVKTAANSNWHLTELTRERINIETIFAALSRKSKS